MYFCYIDESGTPQMPGNTSHYVLAGVSIPISHWKKCDKAISAIKQKYQLLDAEIHTGWILRSYLEQTKIANFEKLSYRDRRYEVDKIRKSELLRLQRINNHSHFKQARKTYKHTDPYIHLTHKERIGFLVEIADWIGKKSFIRIFAECIDKVFFDPAKARRTVDEQALEQLVTRFERYMDNVSTGDKMRYGALIHDNNQTVSRKHTELMKRFHEHGTLFREISHIIETPLFVDSELTSMVQIADLCSVALRRYFENGEGDLLNRISPRFDKYRKNEIVGVRHFTEQGCSCMFCSNK